MFGPKLSIKIDEIGITLRPIEKEEMDDITKFFSSMKIHMHTGRLYGVTKEDEYEWWEKARKLEHSVYWGIQTDKSDTVVGVTSIHGSDPINGNCETGIIIADSKWHGKGIATLAHLLRTMFAADYLNRMTIQSLVRVPNVASRKALERVGYLVTGTELRSAYRAGAYMDSHVLSWIHPEKHQILYPKGLPKELEKPVALAQVALEKARKYVIL